VQTGGDATRLVGTLRALIKFANDTGEHKGDPTAGVKAGKMDKSDGFLAWPPEGEGDDPIAKYRAHYALGTVPRLAIELALNIAARREDMHVIGRQHHKNGAITWRPSKTSRSTGRVLTIDVLPELQQALDAMPASNVISTAFLTTGRGRPFASAAALGNAFADWCIAAGLKPVLCPDGKMRSYRLHGLRTVVRDGGKASLQRLADRGATGPELLEWSGHKNLSEVQPYIEKADGKKRMKNAVAKPLAGSK